MPAIIVQTTYPERHLEAVVEIFKKEQAEFSLPDYMTQEVYVRPSVEGRKSIAVHEVDNGHTGEVIALVNKLMLAYRDVPDFTYSIDVWTEADDALKMLE